MQSTLPILIVEDSPEDFEALVRAFSKARVSNPIYRFSYGEDAFDFLKQRGQVLPARLRSPVRGS